MPSKLQFYSEFAERTARQITGSYLEAGRLFSLRRRGSTSTLTTSSL